mmetsp:Transcript_125852/g.245529  ORF Transcript_125852/g.245529 Transcript_125852/m.245529 type:complete len:175 (+) Transcript_125852:74-598(+)
MQVHRTETAVLMQETPKKTAMTVLLTPLLCFWIPLLFFMAAGNVSSTCETGTFKLWLQLYGIVPITLSLAFMILTGILAKLGNPDMFKSGLQFQALPQIVSLCLLVWGWVTYSKTSDEKCVKEGGINPRLLALVWLILGSIFSPCVLCAIMSQIAAPTGVEYGQEDQPVLDSRP